MNRPYCAACAAHSSLHPQAHHNTVLVSAAASGVSLKPAVSGLVTSESHAAAATAASMRLLSTRKPAGAAGMGPMALPRAVTLAAPYSAVAPTLAEFTRTLPGEQLTRLGVAGGARPAVSTASTAVSQAPVQQQQQRGGARAGGAQLPEPAAHTPSAAHANRQPQTPGAVASTPSSTIAQAPHAGGAWSPR